MARFQYQALSASGEVVAGEIDSLRAGTSDDAYFAALDAGVPALARRALEFAEGNI